MGFTFVRYCKISIIVIIILCLGLSGSVALSVFPSQLITEQSGNFVKDSMQNKLTSDLPSDPIFLNSKQLNISKSGANNFRKSTSSSSHQSLDRTELKNPRLFYQPPIYTKSSIQSDSININDTQQFIDLALPGTGTESDPFRIENLSFITNTSNVAVSITGIMDHVIIQNNTFIHNSISSLGGGIIIEASSNIKITDNVFGNQNTSSEYVISIDLSYSSQVNIINNILNSTRGIIIDSSSNFILQNNTLYSTYSQSIEVHASSNFSIDKNSIIFSGSDAILIDNALESTTSFDFQIINNQIIDPRTSPFELNNGFNFEIMDNMFSSEFHPLILESGDGVREESLIRGCENFLVKNNDFSGSIEWFPINQESYSLVSITDGNNGSIISNTFDKFYRTTDGYQRSDFGIIRVMNFEVMTFANNFITNSNVNGLYMAGVTNITIESNTISNVDLNGIRVAESYSVTISNNDISKTSIGILAHQVGDEYNNFNGKPKDIKIYNNILGNNIYGISILSTELIHIKGNLITNSEIGILLGESNQIRAEENIITQSERGISVTGLDDSIINNNTLHNNFQDGLYIFISQFFHAGELLIENNNIYDQSSEGARGINVISPLGWKYSGITVWNNSIIGNSVGIELFGSGVVISENLISSSVSSTMEYGLKIHSGSKYNQIIFNEFDQTIISHIFIRSSNSSSDEDLISKNNIIAWNNFYSFTVIQAFDEFGLNQFIYNFWSNLNEERDLDSNGILDTVLQIVSSPNALLPSYDSYPLSTPFQKTSVFINPIIPEPVFLSPQDGMSFNNTRTEQLLIEFKWVQSISSDQFMFGNESKFEFSIDYKAYSSKDWINIEEKIVDNGYIWNITDFNDDFYEIRITGTNLITLRVTTSTITLNLGPVLPSDSFFESPRNIALTIIAAVGIASASVYGITTYRHRLQRKRDADVKGRARDYLDVARKIKEDKG